MFKKKYKYMIIKQKKKPLKTKEIIFITLIIFIILNVSSFWVVDKTIEPILITMVKTEVNEMTTSIITKSVRETVSDVKMEDLVIVRDQGEGIPPSYSFNQSIYNMVLADISDNLSEELGKISNQLDSQDHTTTNYSLPLGVITDNSILANFGPDIPIELYLVSDVTPEIKTKLTSSGINNTYLELFVNLKIGIQVAIPSFTDRQLVETDIKIGDIFIPGDVPEYYGGEERIDSELLPIIIDEK